MASPNEIVKCIRDLPPLPAIVSELLASMDQDTMGSKELGEKLARDQSLSAKTLRLSNSSFYGMQRKVTTIPQAITVLGVNSVRTLVTAAGLIGAFSKTGADYFDIKLFWQHSIACALCAKALARHVNVNPDHAFMAGLLHDIGQLVLITYSPLEYGRVVAYRAERDCDVLEAERAIFQIDHAVAGLALAECWKFPLVIQKAIAQHHQPDRQEIGSLAPLLHVADAVSHALDLTGVEHEMVPVIHPAVWAGLHPNAEIFRQVFQEAEEQFDDACQILTS